MHLVLGTLCSLERDRDRESRSWVLGRHIPWVASSLEDGTMLPLAHVPPIFDRPCVVGILKDLGFVQ